MPIKFFLDSIVLLHFVCHFHRYCVKLLVDGEVLIVFYNLYILCKFLAALLARYRQHDEVACCVARRGTLCLFRSGDHAVQWSATSRSFIQHDLRLCQRL